MSRRNKTQQNVIEAITAALDARANVRDVRGVVAFLTGYFDKSEPEIAAVLEKALKELA